MNMPGKSLPTAIAMASALARAARLEGGCAVDGGRLSRMLYFGQAISLAEAGAELASGAESA